MATNEQAAGTNAEWDTDDDLNEANLREVDARSNAADFVERGCGFTADFNNDTLTIGSTGGNAPNYAIVLDSHRRYHLFPSQATVSLHASTTNHVFIAYGDVDSDGTDEVYYHVDDDNSAPSDPSLKIGEVDTSADTTTTTNRDPATTHQSVDTGELAFGTGTSKNASEHRQSGISVGANATVTITFTDVLPTDTVSTYLLIQAGETPSRASAVYLANSYGTADDATEIAEIGITGDQFDLKDLTLTGTDIKIDLEELNGSDWTVDASLVHLSTEH